MKPLLLTLLTVTLTGCTSITYTDKDVTFKRTSFLTSLKIKSIKKTASGLVVEGYANDQVEGAALVAEAVARGVMTGVKP